MKTFFTWALALLFITRLTAAETLTEQLQRGLFEEEANRNLDAAIKAYQSVIKQSDEERKIVATAVFRLAECYRKLGKTNEANAQYQRVLRDFSDQEALAALSQSLLPRDEIPRTIGVATREMEQRVVTLRVALAEQRATLDRIAKLSLSELLDVKPFSVDPQIVELQRRQAETQQKLAALRTQFGEEYPDVRAARATQKALEGQVADRAAGLQRGLSQEMKTIEAQLAALEKELFAANPVRDERTAGTSSEMTQAEADDLARVKTLARNSPDLLETSATSTYNELQLAAQKGNYSVVEFLLSQGVKLDGQKVGPPPLTMAAEQGHLRIVKLLVEKGAKVDPTFRVKTPLVAAAGRGFKSVVEFLLSAGADVNRTTSDETSALIAATANRQVAIVELLLKRGAAVDILSRERFNIPPGGIGATGGTALHRAAANGSVELAEMLVNARAYIYATNFDGMTPLHVAAVTGNTNLCLLLLTNGAQVNARDNDGYTPFSRAVEQNRLDAVRVLFDGKFHPDTTGGFMYNGRRSHVLDVAISNDPAETAAEMLQLVLGAKPDVNATNGIGQTPLVQAVMQKSFRKAELLLAAGADPNKPSPPWNSPLHYAVGLGQPRVVELLLAHRADLTAKNHRGLSVDELLSVVSRYNQQGVDLKPLDVLYDPSYRFKSGLPTSYGEITEILRKHRAASSGQQ